MLNSIICNILSFIYGILVYKFINNNVAFYILCICFLIFTIYLIVINKSKIKKLSQELQKSKNYNNNLQLLYDEVITFRHDFGNIIQSIGGYVDNNDIQGLKEYYNQIKVDCENIKSLEILNPSIINNPAVYNLLSSKYCKAISNRNINEDTCFIGFK